MKYKIRGSVAETREIAHKKKQKALKKCGTCYGYGMWAFGLPAPMGPLDAGAGGEGGMPTIACPECGANKNPI